jgi:hypothetical protein
MIVYENFCHDVVLQPAAQPIKRQVVSLLEASAQITEKPERGLGLAPVLEQLVKIQQAIGFLARDRVRLAQQLRDHFQ